jgi:hypothetical protein
MVADSTSTLISLELDMGFGYGRVAQAVYSSGDAVQGHAALQEAWAAWERAKSILAMHEVEELHLRLLGLEAFLRGIEEKSTVN